MCVLSGAEIELLVAGYLSLGILEIVSRRPGELSVRARERHHPPHEADYWDRFVGAFQSLCARGFLRHDRGASFLLTETGWHHARNAIAEFLRERAVWARRAEGPGSSRRPSGRPSRCAVLGRRSSVA